MKKMLDQLKAAEMAVCWLVLHNFHIILVNFCVTIFKFWNQSAQILLLSEKQTWCKQQADSVSSDLKN